MAKINLEGWTYRGMSALRGSKKKGDISKTEIYEALERQELWGTLYLQMHKVEDERPQELDEIGDEVVLVNAEELVSELIEYYGIENLGSEDQRRRWKERLDEIDS